MKTDWDGFYLDGRTAERKPASVRIMRLGLHISTLDGQSHWWPYEAIRQTQGSYAGEQVRLERGGEIPEVLLIADTSFLVSLQQLARNRQVSTTILSVADDGLVSPFMPP